MAFAQTGGIEKFNSCFLLALKDIAEKNGWQHAASLLYDNGSNAAYYPESRFKGYKNNRILFLLSTFLQCRKFNTIIIGHINLAILALAVRFFFPRKKVIMILHGVEVMEPVGGIRKMALQWCSQLIAVSRFTRNNLIQLQGIAPEKVVVFNNTIDPYFKLPTQFDKPEYLIQRYGIRPGEKLLFALTRLKWEEGYKGYDQVIRALPLLKQQGLQVRYLIAGKADERSTAQVAALVEELGLKDNVALLGFLPDEEVTDHYLLSDVFVMPSKKEGFGIVFIEAMACGLPVVAGNKDGSTEALADGALGKLVDPDSPEAIAAAVAAQLAEQAPVHGKLLQDKVLERFGFPVFKKNLEQILNTAESRS